MAAVPPADGMNRRRRAHRVARAHRATRAPSRAIQEAATAPARATDLHARRRRDRAMNWVGFIIMGLFALAVGLGVFHIFSGLASGARRIQSKRRDEALFASMFPDLQPYFHPERLVEFVRAQRSRKRGSVTTSGSTTWENPPGLGVHLLEIEQG